MKLILYVLLILSLVTTSVNGADWLNYWNKPANFQCPTGQWLSRIISKHSNLKEDRRWNFECTGQGKTLSNCKWTDYHGNYQNDRLFICPEGKVIAGINSVHKNSEKDRQFQYLCCTMDGYVHTRCRSNAYANDWDGDMDFQIYTKRVQVITGAFSKYQKSMGDRRWRFITCVMESIASLAPPCPTPPQPAAPPPPAALAAQQSAVCPPAPPCDPTLPSGRPDPTIFSVWRDYLFLVRKWVTKKN